ncbi:hypothetical protein ACLOAV_001956 [Pseudogymnoascus australis]
MFDRPKTGIGTTQTRSIQPRKLDVESDGAYLEVLPCPAVSRAGRLGRIAWIWRFQGSRAGRLERPAGPGDFGASEPGDSGDWLIWRCQVSREPSCSHAPRSPEPGDSGELPGSGDFRASEPGDSGDWPDLAIIPSLQKQWALGIGPYTFGYIE